jgi:hypothetical protein
MFNARRLKVQKFNDKLLNFCYYQCSNFVGAGAARSVSMFYPEPEPH